jgi:dienelactone hydrolase
MRPSLLLLCFVTSLQAARFPEKTPDTPGNRMLQNYWERQVNEIEQTGGLKDIQSADDWKAKAPEYRRQLAEMLGLDPLPERTPLQATKTGDLAGDGWRVEKMHYQAVPGLYVTANLYLPAKVEKPLPAILYVCGHANVVKDGVSYGNKTGYHHHGIWFARHGYVCLIIDTVQLGEIRGEHHGTYSKGRWWWYSRGYTPAGLEAWAGMRGLDYLETRPEVDKTRFGVTGRSGGGAYSWWVAALDERIKAAAPTAGVTNMRNHVVDGCVEGHCDCMFYVNTYRWDYDRLVALVAPRALLICNTDKDSIFPINGVFDLHQKVSRIYTLLGADDKLGLQVAEGPHKDLQPLNNGAFHWFERHLKGADPMAVLDEGAKKQLEPEQLQVFKELPKDEKNTTIDETFVPQAKTPEVPGSQGDWNQQKETWMTTLKDKVLAGWPKEAAAIQPNKEGRSERDGIEFTAYDFESEPGVRLRLHIAHRAGLRLEDLELVALNVLDAEGWDHFIGTYHSRFGKHFDVFPSIKPDEKAFESEKKMFETFKWGMAYLAPRGVGPTEWTGSEKAQTQRLRRFYLLGQTADSMRAWDIRRAVQAVKQIAGLEKKPLWIQGQRDMAVNALYASLFEDGITRLDLHELPTSHASGPAYLNVLKYLDLPQAAALAAEKTRVIIYSADEKAWAYPAGVVKLLGLPEKQWQIRKPMSAE